MNMTPKEAVGLVNKLRDKVAGSDVEVVFCVPAIDIIPVVEAVKGTDIKVGAENMHYEEKGAFTGEISPGMLVDSGVSYVILGHSERRQYFGEDDDCINRKVRKAIEYGITPIICCGETIQQREEGITLDFIKNQINAAFTQVSPDDAADCVIAYEPIWAIGTGRVATSKQAQEVCEAIRCNIRELYGDDVAAKVRILYGGSVNASNAKELFVGKNARLRYSTIENWSKNMYNLNTKRALVEEGGTIEWVSGSFGSHVSYLYPMSILKGRDSKMEFTGITFAGKGQNLDTGAKVVHIGENTSSYINTKSISKDGGISTFRSSVVVNKGAESAKSAVSCQSLMLDSESRSDTIPAMDIRTKNANVGHEAQIGSISDEAVFYLMSRGMSEEDARACIVSGFADNVSKELPLEYALEMNNLIRLEMKGSIG